MDKRAPNPAANRSSGRVFVISGPSGVGKGTICNRLLMAMADDPSINFSLSTSVTSRLPRPRELDGVDYFFVSREEFERMIRDGELVEWAEYNGNYYGTPSSQLNRLTAKGENVLLEIDVQGAMMVKRLFPDSILIFLAPPSMEELEARLRGRKTNTEEEIQARLRITHEELAVQDQFDHVFVNRDLNECYDAVMNILRNSMASVPTDARR